MQTFTPVTAEDFQRIDNDRNGNPRYFVAAHDVRELTHEKLNRLGFRKSGKAGYTIQSYNIEADAREVNRAIYTHLLTGTHIKHADADQNSDYVLTFRDGTQSSNSYATKQSARRAYERYADRLAEIAGLNY